MSEIFSHQPVFSADGPSDGGAHDERGDLPLSGERKVPLEWTNPDTGEWQMLPKGISLPSEEELAQDPVMHGLEEFFASSPSSALPDLMRRLPNFDFPIEVQIEDESSVRAAYWRMKCEELAVRGISRLLNDTSSAEAFAAVENCLRTVPTSKNIILHAMTVSTLLSPFGSDEEQAKALPGLPRPLAELLLTFLTDKRGPGSSAILACKVLLQAEGYGDSYRFELESSPEEEGADGDIQIYDSSDRQLYSVLRENPAALIEALVRASRATRELESLDPVSVSTFISSRWGELEPVLAATILEKEEVPYGALYILNLVLQPPPNAQYVHNFLSTRHREKIPNAVIERVAAGLGGEDPHQLRLSLGILGGVGYRARDYVESILPFVHHAAQEVRDHAVRALGLIGEPVKEIEETILSLWQANYEGVRPEVSGDEFIRVTGCLESKAERAIGARALFDSLAAIADKSYRAKEILFSLFDRASHGRDVFGSILQFGRTSLCQEAAREFFYLDRRYRAFPTLAMLPLKLRGADMSPVCSEIAERIEEKLSGVVAVDDWHQWVRLQSEFLAMASATRDQPLLKRL